MCNGSEFDISAEDQLYDVIIKGIQKEIAILKEFYFYSLADYRFEVIKNYYIYEAEETGKSLKDKAKLYEQMYIEIVNYLYEETRIPHTDPHYPECEGEIEYQTEETIEESDELPF